MPPKYYCDYCDKQFHDTPASRKRHTQGSLHQRAKKLWFDSFKDPDDVKTGVCSYFMRTGNCQYAQNCKYLHPTPPGLVNLGTNLSDLNVYGQTVGPTSTTHFGPIAGILYYCSPHKTCIESRQFHRAVWIPRQPDESCEVVTTIRESKLPPSLQPPPEGGYPDLLQVAWG